MESLNCFNGILNNRRTEKYDLVLFYSGLIHRYEETSKEVDTEEERQFQFKILLDDF